VHSSVIAALTQLYREQGRYLERIYKWAKRIGSTRKSGGGAWTTSIAASALYDRFVFSQKFAQSIHGAERVSGKDKHEFAPMAALSLQEAAE
jgi:nitrite reductase (NADH) large subunit